MAETRTLSVTKVIAATGGALLVASFFLPLLAVRAGADVGREIFGVDNLKREIEELRSVEATRPLIEPALQQLEVFSASPSLRNLSTLAAASREVAQAAVGFGVDDPELPKLVKILGLVRTCLWLLPLVGLVQVIVPLVSRLRGHAGFVGLVARFVFGLLFAFVALLPVAGVAEQHQGLIGSAVWVLLAGSLLMIAAGLFGVTRRNWWAVLPVDVAVLLGASFSVVRLAESL